MNTAIDSGRFTRELGGWAVRGFLCAVPSAFWAATFDFHDSVEIAAMVAGVGLWIVAYAWFCAQPVAVTTGVRARFRRALKIAAWIKSVLLLGALVAWVLVLHGKVHGAYLAWGVAPDVCLGIGAVGLVESLAGMKQELALGQLNSFGWTLLTTVVQGAFITVLLAAGAGVVMVWSGFWSRLDLRGKFSPARFAG